MTIFEGQWLKHWEEAIGMLREVQQLEGYALAEIGPVKVALPTEMGNKLNPYIGLRVGILRTEKDYRMRVVSTSRPNIQSAIAQSALLEKIPTGTMTSKA